MAGLTAEKILPNRPLKTDGQVRALPMFTRVLTECREHHPIILKVEHSLELTIFR